MNERYSMQPMSILKKRSIKFIAATVSLILLSGYSIVYFTIIIVSGEPVEILTPYEFAKEDQTLSDIPLKVMTANIAHGRGDSLLPRVLGKERVQENLNFIAGLVNRVDPDIIAYQEIDQKAFWSGNFNHLRVLAHNTNMPFSVQGVHVDSSILAYGTALSSKYEIVEAKSYTFPPTPPTFSKGWTKITIRYPMGSDTYINMVSVHLDFSRKSQRINQVGSLVSHLANDPNPLILMGDLNSSIGNEGVLEKLVSELELQVYEPNSNDLVTFPALNQRIDWILISNDLEFLSYSTLEEKVSDHLAVVASIAIKP